MAELGMSLLDAINELLRGSGFAPVTTTPVSSAVDESAEAEDVLVRMKQKLLTPFMWPENTEIGVSHTPLGTGTGGTAIAGDGAWTAATRTLVKASAFPADASAAGGEIYIVSGTLVKEGYYGITTNANANTVTLDHQIAVANQTDVTAARFGALKVTVGSTVLNVRSSPNSPNGHRNLVLQADDVIYDADRQVARLANDDPIYLDLTKDYTFEDLAPRLKETIVAMARLEFQRFKKGLVDRDNFLNQEAMIAEMMSERIQPHVPTQQPFSALLQSIKTIRQTQQ